MAVAVMANVQGGNNMFRTGNGAGFLIQNGGVVPPSLLQESRVPRFYIDAIAKCGAPNPSQLPCTALVYNLMVTSRLPRVILGNIWSLVNRTVPGQLTRQEFFSCLALIALIQKGQPLSALSTMSTLPIPHLQACASFSQFLSSGDSCKEQKPSVDCFAVPSNSPLSIPTTSSAISLLSDINFFLPVSTSPDLAQSISVKLIPTSQSYPLISNSEMPHADATEGNTKVFGADLSQFLENTISSSNQVLSSNAQQTADTSSEEFVLLSEFSNNTTISTKSDPLSLHSEMRNTSYVNVSTRSLGRTLEPIRKIYVIKEEYLSVWQRCIEEAHKLLSSANTLLLDSETASVSEVAQTDRGARYFHALYEIYEVTVRIREGRMSKLVKHKKLFEDIDRIWARLKVFAEKTNDDRNESTKTTGNHPFCDICLSYVLPDSHLEFTGSIYHKQCANLWINRVNSLLPKVKN
ncbi:unnamed protein product [Thelazia callipaeda]|uniref:EH domain-containing protein n=1 Tax=Thelazia callipaeda TaxID=103827 RepID=A0A0N5D5L5_THECL|nr:unnamed protein product [Thelazia callipaeda]